MPVKMAELRDLIGIKNGKPSLKLSNPLFPRIESSQRQIDKAETPVKPITDSTKPEITIDDFAKLDLRTAKIVSARRVENADKLLVLQIDIGNESRQIVAGIGQSYAPEELIGREIVVIANLKPVKLRGETSQGMLLAVGDGKRHFLITPESGAPIGGKIK
jgi:methionyl-tRNA synthetase